MAPISPEQQLRRKRVEGLIQLAAPFLDVMLTVGDRLSRVVSPGDDYIPIRPPSEAFELDSTRRRASQRELTE